MKSRNIKALAATAALALPFALAGIAEAKRLTYHSFDTLNGVNTQTQGNSCGSPLSLTSNPTRASRKALKIDMKNCHRRGEVVAAKTLEEGKTYWLSWSMYVPQKFPSWTIVAQFGPKGAWMQRDRFINISNPIGSIMTLGNDGKFNLRLTRYQKQGNRSKQVFNRYSTTAKIGDWNDFVVKIKPARNGSGEVVFWHNGKKFAELGGAFLPHWISSVGDFKVGGYNGRTGRGNRLMYIDEVKVGTSSKDVGFDNPPPSSGNKAFGKPVKVTSQPRSDYLGRFAVDGKTDTRWAAQNYPQEITITLADRPVPISRLEVAPYRSDRRALQFIAVAGDGRVLVDARDNTKTGTIVANFGQKNVQHVRVRVTGCHGGGCSSSKWFGIEEVRVY